MKVSSSKVALAVAFSAIMSCSVCFAESSAPSMEDMMGEGIAFTTVQQESVNVITDNTNPTAENMMGEGIAYSHRTSTVNTEVEGHDHSLQSLMSEGICLEHMAGALASN